MALQIGKGFCFSPLTWPTHLFARCAAGIGLSASRKSGGIRDIHQNMILKNYF
jgi:hypothetical protein